MDGSEGYQEGTKQAESGKILNYMREPEIENGAANRLTCKLAVVVDCTVSLPCDLRPLGAVCNIVHE